MLLDSFFFGQEIWPFGSVLVCTLRPTQDAHGGSEFARPCQAAPFPTYRVISFNRLQCIASLFSSFFAKCLKMSPSLNQMNFM